VTNLARAYFSTYQIGNDSVDLSSDIYFIDGLVGINSNASVLTGKSDATRYALIVDKNSRLIDTHGLTDGDVLVGRERNYILFRAGDQLIKSTEISVIANQINITANKIVFNGIELFVEAGKLKIKVGSELKEVVVVGGTADTTTGKIITSGQ